MAVLCNALCFLRVELCGVKFSCGFTSLLAAAKFLDEKEAGKVLLEETIQLAKELRLTRQGEMFSSMNYIFKSAVLYVKFCSLQANGWRK